MAGRRDLTGSLVIGSGRLCMVEMSVAVIVFWEQFFGVAFRDSNLARCLAPAVP